MFSQLFLRSDAITRQLSAPLAYERGQYLNHCTAQGMSKKTLREKARFLIVIAECLRSAERADDIISLQKSKQRQCNGHVTTGVLVRQRRLNIWIVTLLTKHPAG
jgi:hypothetical protein